MEELPVVSSKPFRVASGWGDLMDYSEHFLPTITYQRKRSAEDVQRIKILLQYHTILNEDVTLMIMHEAKIYVADSYTMLLEKDIPVDTDDSGSIMLCRTAPIPKRRRMHVTADGSTQIREIARPVKEVIVTIATHDQTWITRRWWDRFTLNTIRSEAAPALRETDLARNNNPRKGIDQEHVVVLGRNTLDDNARSLVENLEPGDVIEVRVVPRIEAWLSFVKSVQIVVCTAGGC